MRRDVPSGCLWGWDMIRIARLSSAEGGFNAPVPA